LPRLSKNIFKFLFFTRAQGHGIVILSLILFLLVVLYALLPWLISGDHNFDSEDFEKNIAAFSAAPLIIDEAKILNPFIFDPNTISKEEMLNLGLSEYQAGMILKYRGAGGSFDDARDFEKIYSISDEEYQRLAPYIKIPPKLPKPQEMVKEVPVLKPFAFDPNTADSNTLQALGLADYQLANVLNYRNAGGKFRCAEDFQKLYTIDEATFAQLEKYIRLPQPDTSMVELDKRAIPFEIIEINSADALSLQKVKGIGPVYAKRIIAYREKLGGFYSKLQLLEVFGIDTSKYEGIAKQISIDSNRIVKLDLNESDFKDLLRHPYMEYYFVKSIFEYKDLLGLFYYVAELKKIDLVYNHLYQRISPYFCIRKNEKTN
jgi:competence ComEA-like helix-hairpin-helix protein